MLTLSRTNISNSGFVPLCDHETQYFQEPLEETDDTPVVVTTEEVDDVMKCLEVGDPDSDQVLMDKILKFTFKCKQRRKYNGRLGQESCTNILDPDFIYESCYMMAALTEQEKDMFIMGQLFCNGKRQQTPHLHHQQEEPALTRLSRV